MESKIRKFVAEQQLFVKRQLQAEMGLPSSPKGIFQASATPNRKGSGLDSLRIARLDMDAGGCTAVIFAIPPNCEKSKITEFRKGDIVSVDSDLGVYRKDGESCMEGVLLKISTSEVSVAIGKKDKIPENWDTGYTMWRLATDISYCRMLSALSELERMGDRPELHAVLFGEMTPQSNEEVIDFFNTSLNDSQKVAVTEAVNSTTVSLIHGPPGTGKTHTIVEIVRQLRSRGLRVLVCGPSNVAADNLTERLGSYNELRLVRLGHPSRILPGAVEYCLDKLICETYEGKIIVAKRNRLKWAIKSLETARYYRRDELYSEISSLRNEIQVLEKEVTSRIIGESKVVLSTLCGSGADYLSEERFDVVVIDEASQAQEAECWIAALKAPRLILAGDQHQLPPTIMLPNEEVETMFDRIKDMWPSVSRMLNIQYRMHRDIAQVSCDVLYESKLVPHSSVEGHLLCGMSFVRRTENTSVPLVLVDTADANMPESTRSWKKKSANDNSKSNEFEADIAVKH
ncbi:hypothetical protein LPJ56_004883, partial [Coemansia sp. RSA 2599]